jgi:hypothetical protein
MLSMMDPYAGCPLGNPGNNLWNKGPKSLPSNETTPPFSPTFISPIQRDRTPVRPKDISNPVFALLKIEFTSSLKICVLPPKNNCPSATTKPIRKKAIQI